MEKYLLTFTKNGAIVCAVTDNSDSANNITDSTLVFESAETLVGWATKVWPKKRGRKKRAKVTQKPL